MQKITYLLFVGLIFIMKVNAQTNPGTTLSKNDSLDILNQLKELLSLEDKPVSYGYANIGIGNRLFSVKNNALNGFQNNASQVIYSPSLGYFHKTGLGLTAGANLLNDVTGFGVNQYSVMPSYNLMGNKTLGVDISYTHYFVKNKFSEFSSPVQDDFYASFRLKKPWLSPGVALGYATGQYKEANYKDTVINGIRRYIYDSVTNDLKIFSLTVSASHQFDWYSVFNKSDGFGVTPTLLVNAGSGRTTISHKTNAPLLFNLLKRRGKIPLSQENKFEIQSVGLSLYLNYTIGNLVLEPQLYLDYYIPDIDADAKRFTQVFTFTVGYLF